MLVSSNAARAEIKSLPLRGLCGYLSELTSAARTLEYLPGSSSSPSSSYQRVMDAIRSCWQLASVIEEVRSTRCWAYIEDGHLQLALVHHQPPPPHHTPAASSPTQRHGSLLIGYSPFADHHSLSSLADKVTSLVVSHQDSTDNYALDESVFTSNPSLDGLLLDITIVDVLSIDMPVSLRWGSLHQALSEAKKDQEERIALRVGLLAKRVERARQMVLATTFDKLQGHADMLRLLEIGPEERPSLLGPLAGASSSPSSSSFSCIHLSSSPKMSPLSDVVPTTPSTDYIIPVTSTSTTPSSTLMSPLPSASTFQRASAFSETGECEGDNPSTRGILGGGEGGPTVYTPSRINEFIHFSANLPPTESLCSLLRHTSFVLERTEDFSRFRGGKRDRVDTSSNGTVCLRCRVDVVPRLDEDTCQHGQTCMGNVEMLFVVVDEDSASCDPNLNGRDVPPIGYAPLPSSVRLWYRMCVDWCSEPRLDGSCAASDWDGEGKGAYRRNPPFPEGGLQMVVWNGGKHTIVPLAPSPEDGDDNSLLSVVPLSAADATDIVLWGSTYDPLPTSPHLAKGTIPSIPLESPTLAYLTDVASALCHAVGSYHFEMGAAAVGGITAPCTLPVERLRTGPWSTSGRRCAEEGEEEDGVNEGILQCPLYFMDVEVGRAYPSVVPIASDGASISLSDRINRWFIMPLRFDAFVLPAPQSSSSSLPIPGQQGVVGMTLFSGPPSDKDIHQRGGAAKVLRRLLMCIAHTDGSPIGISLSIDRGGGDSKILMALGLSPLGGGVISDGGTMSLRVSATPLPLGMLSPSIPMGVPFRYPFFPSLHGLAAFIDLDRTLVDNSPTLIDSLGLNAVSIHYRVWTHGEAIERKERVIIRPGVSRFLRGLSLAGVLLILVTKSKRGRARAVLKSLVDPQELLFGPLSPNEFGPLSPRVMCSEDIAAAAQSHTSVNVQKSISRVVTFYHNTYDRCPPLQQHNPSRWEKRPLRRCFILDDTPADWIAEDLPSLIHVWPFTLGGGWTGDVSQEEEEWRCGQYAYAIAVMVARLTTAGQTALSVHSQGTYATRAQPAALCAAEGGEELGASTNNRSHDAEAADLPSMHKYGDSYLGDSVVFSVPRIFTELPTTNVVAEIDEVVSEQEEGIYSVTAAAPVHHRVVVEEGSSAFSSNTPERSCWDDGDVEEVVPL